MKRVLFCLDIVVEEILPKGLKRVYLQVVNPGHVEFRTVRTKYL